MAAPASLDGGRSHLHKDLLDECDPGTCEKHRPLHLSTRSTWGASTLATCITVVLTIVIFCLVLTTSIHRLLTPKSPSGFNGDFDKHNGQWVNCGKTVDDALARGCRFDMMGNNWVPPLCHDVTFANESARGNTSFAALFGVDEFQWYEQPLLSNVIEDLEPYLINKARRGEEVTAYTSESWHIAHCMYWLSVGVNAMNRLNQGERDIWVPRVVRKPEHARHCSMITGHLFVEDQAEANATTPKVFFGYATCVRLA